jgi:hypothetical protein
MRAIFEIEERPMKEFSVLTEIIKRQEDRRRSFHSQYGDQAPEPQIMDDIESLVEIVSTLSALVDYVNSGSSFWTDDNIRRLISNARHIAKQTGKSFK